MCSCKYSSKQLLMSCLIWFCFLFYVLHSSTNVDTVTCTFTGFTEFVLAEDQHVFNISPCLAREPLGLLPPWLRIQFEFVCVRTLFCHMAGVPISSQGWVDIRKRFYQCFEFFVLYSSGASRHLVFFVNTFCLTIALKVCLYLMIFYHHCIDYLAI